MKRALALSTIGFAIMFAVWGMISALAPKFVEKYHLSFVQKSVLIAIPVLLGSIGRLPMGRVRRFGRLFPAAGRRYDLDPNWIVPLDLFCFQHSPRYVSGSIALSLFGHNSITPHAGYELSELL
jgi:hypothetical protein